MPSHPWPAIWTTVQRYSGGVSGIAARATTVELQLQRSAWCALLSGRCHPHRSRITGPRALSRCILVDVTLHSCLLVCSWRHTPSSFPAAGGWKSWSEGGEARGGQAGRGLAPRAPPGQTNTSTPDPPSFSANAIGHLFRGEARPRSPAKPSPRGRRRPLPCQHAGGSTSLATPSARVFAGPTPVRGSIPSLRHGGESPPPPNRTPTPARAWPGLISPAARRRRGPKRAGSLHSSVSPGPRAGKRSSAGEFWTLGKGNAVWGPVFPGHLISG